MRWTVDRLLARIRRRLPVVAPLPASSEYVLLDVPPVENTLRGWHQPVVAARQDAAFDPLLQQLREGAPRLDFSILAEAVQRTGIDSPSIVEVGCASGWNSEVLSALLGREFGYVGVDYSNAMLTLARQRYPERLFVAGDATALPFRSATFDIAVSGTCLMHVVDYASAIAESRRVARRWCVFHTVPVLANRRTTILRKKAYGESAVEVIFNEMELRGAFERYGLGITAALGSLPYDLGGILGEQTSTKTFVCEILAP